MTPEGRLWKAVIIFLYRDICELRIRYNNSTNGQLKDIVEEMEKLRKLIDDPWIMEICEYAELDHRQFKKKSLAVLDGLCEFQMPYYRSIYSL